MAETETPRLAVPINADDHVRGPAAAACTLLEYGDYQCPYCGRAHPIVQQLRRELGDDLRLVFRHFPLFDIHPLAENAAEAAEAAGAQGKFWEMHDLLFEHQRALEFEDLVGYAAAIGLDRGHFETDLIERWYVENVRRIREGGVRSHVTRTPTFFINGQYYGGAHEVDALRDVIQTVIANARSSYVSAEPRCHPGRSEGSASCHPEARHRSSRGAERRGIPREGGAPIPREIPRSARDDSLRVPRCAPDDSRPPR